MAAYREPGFQERVALAARSKSAALAKLRAKPPIDEAEQAARTARALARETAAAEKRAAQRFAREEVAAAKRGTIIEIIEKSAAVDTPAGEPAPTDADRKAARDARYAARKGRKSK